MTLFLDTSVLVAAFLGDHPGHTASVDIFRQCKPGQAFCAGHTLAETYSTLTRIPPPYRATAEEANRFLDTICESLSIVSLEPMEYRETLHQASTAGIVGGSVYDFLIASCARKAAATRLYTWNLRHYERLGAGFAEVLSPV